MSAKGATVRTPIDPAPPAALETLTAVRIAALEARLERRRLTVESLVRILAPRHGARQVRLALATAVTVEYVAVRPNGRVELRGAVE